MQMWPLWSRHRAIRSSPIRLPVAARHSLLDDSSLLRRLRTRPPTTVRCQRGSQLNSMLPSRLTQPPRSHPRSALRRRWLRASDTARIRIRLRRCTEQQPVRASPRRRCCTAKRCPTTTTSTRMRRCVLPMISIRLRLRSSSTPTPVALRLRTLELQIQLPMRISALTSVTRSQRLAGLSPRTARSHVQWQKPSQTSLPRWWLRRHSLPRLSRFSRRRRTFVCSNFHRTSTVKPSSFAKCLVACSCRSRMSSMTSHQLVGSSCQAPKQTRQPVVILSSPGEHAAL